MDYLDELESMAQFAIAMPADQDDQTIDKATIQRWQGLFIEGKGNVDSY